MKSQQPTPTRGVEIVLDRPRHLRYSLGTIRRMREDFGVAEGADLEFNLELLPRLLWWGLRHEDADLTVEQIEEMVDGENMHAVVEAMNKAFGSQALLVRRPEDPLKAAASPLPPGAPADSSGRAAT